MNRFQKELQMKRAKEKQRIKKEYVDTGDHDKLLKRLHEKCKSSIDITDVPF